MTFLDSTGKALGLLLYSACRLMPVCQLTNRPKQPSSYLTWVEHASRQASYMAVAHDAQRPGKAYIYHQYIRCQYIRYQYIHYQYIRYQYQTASSKTPKPNSHPPTQTRPPTHPTTTTKHSRALHYHCTRPLPNQFFAHA
eukprot:363806-Chlamydomonas_euryale.AAC.4